LKFNYLHHTKITKTTLILTVFMTYTFTYNFTVKYLASLSATLIKAFKLLSI